MIRKIQFPCFLLMFALASVGCNSSTAPTQPEGPLPSDRPASEVYLSPAGYIETSSGRVEIPEGAFRTKVLEVRPGRGSVLTDLQSSGAGVVIEVTASADLPDLKYMLPYQVSDENGNDLPTQWLSGTGSKISPGESKILTLVVPIDPGRNIPARVPALKLNYAWARNGGGFSDYIFDLGGNRMKTLIPLNWHRP